MASERNQDRKQTFTPGPTPNSVRATDGRVLTAPQGWTLLPPGDAALFLAAPESSYVNGHILTVDGGWTAGYHRDF